MDNQSSITHDSEISFFTFLIIILVFLLTLSFILDLRIKRNDISAPSEVVSKPFPLITLKAKAAYVYDIRTETILFAKNEDVRLPLASLAKVMSALVAEDLSPSYSTITIVEEALKTEGDSGFFKDEKWFLGDILDFSLLTSSNDGMRAVALSLGALSRSAATSEEIVNDFIGEMNIKASELGLKNMYFWNETGLDELDIRSGAYGSAKDIGILLEYIILHNPELLVATRDTMMTIRSLDNFLHIAKNTNSLASEIPGLIASKTGFTDIAGGNLAVVFDPELGHPIIVVILGSTEQGRFEDVRALVNAVMEYVTTN